MKSLCIVEATRFSKDVWFQNWLLTNNQSCTQFSARQWLLVSSINDKPNFHYRYIGIKIIFHFPRTSFQPKKMVPKICSGNYNSLTARILKLYFHCFSISSTLFSRLRSYNCSLTSTQQISILQYIFRDSQTM